MKKLLIGMAVFLLFGVSGGVTLAYLSGEDMRTNLIRAAETDIEVTEEFDPPEEINPGCEIRKIPRIHNIAQSPCYVRAACYFSDLEAEQCCEKLQIREGWTLKEDGYYYWGELLQPDEMTGPLFEKVVIRKDVDKNELKPFELLVYAEAVQGDLDMETAWKNMSR